MAAHGWGGSVLTGVGVAAGAGAAQLGVGYGLGVIAWPASVAGANETGWVASLAWATWIASTSAVAGAFCADRLGPSAVSTLEGRSTRGTLATSLWRVALALAAAIGALITVPLVGVPARAVSHPQTPTPEIIAGGYAVVGVVLGLIVTIAALAARAIATNVVTSVSWLWLLAIIAVIDGVAAGRGLNTAQLAVWQFTASGPVIRNIHAWQALLTLGAALVIGALSALPAARRGDNPVGVAVSGAVGPLLVAAAYFLAAPDFALVQPRELSAYLVMPYAVIAGLAGSVTVAGLGPRLPHRSRPAPETAGTAGGRIYGPAGAAGDTGTPARQATSTRPPEAASTRTSGSAARGAAPVPAPAAPKQARSDASARSPGTAASGPAVAAGAESESDASESDASESDASESGTSGSASSGSATPVGSASGSGSGTKGRRGRSR